MLSGGIAPLWRDVSSHAESKVIEDLLVGLVALAVAVVLLAVGLPNRRGESPRFLRAYAAPMLYPAIILVFIAIGVAELISWAARVF
jgi:hypothetical protein